MGCCLLGLLFAADYLIPKEAAPAPAVAATVSNGSLASWRQSQEKHEKLQVSAVIYPDVAPLPPTAERLQWERQMTYRRPDSPAALEARAELPATAAAAITSPPAKHVAKLPARPRTVARADRHDRPNYAAAYPPAPMSQFNGYRQAQFDRPAGGFFNFRMF
jgi:hypothetical protein